MPLNDIRADQEGAVLAVNTSGKIVRDDGTSIQPAAPAGNTHTPTAGSTTSVFVNTTFDGGTGSTAYTVGDIVLALKTLGLIAS